jgi:SOS-response transcriptional repressor LexA
MDETQVSAQTIDVDNAVCNRIKTVRQTRGLTQKNFASSVGIVQGYLSDIERGRKIPSYTLLLAICHLYGVTEEWLLHGRGVKDTKLPAGNSAAIDSATSPLLGNICDTFPEAIRESDVTMLLQLPDLPANSYAIKSDGDYMAPTIRDGDLVFFIHGEKMENGDIALLTNTWGEIILRRYRIRNNDVYFSPDNNNYAPFKPIPATKIIGKVVGIWRKIKF